ncbi:MAG: GldG family protein [Spirochaetota bacterium]
MGNFFKDILSNPKVKYGGYAGIITFVIVVAVLVLNVLVQQLGWQIDMTETSVYTLSEQTRDILNELDEDVTIYVLAERNQEDQRIMEALERYEQASGRISLETVDAEQNPGFVSRFDPEGEGLGNGSVIVATEDNFRAIQNVDLFSIDNRNPRSPQILGLNVEQRITNALIFVATGRTPVVYQTQGHGELELSSGGAFGRLGEQFRNANLELRTVNLATASQVPEDGSIVAIVRPRDDFSAEEVDKLAEFLDDGGKLFLAVELAAGELPNIAQMLERYGIGIPAAVVVEPDRNYNAGQPLQLAPVIEETDITTPLIEADYRVVTPIARPVLELETRPRGVTYEALLSTSEESFYRTQLDIETAEMTPDDIPGPVPVAATAIEREFTTSEEISRIVVVGDVDFISLVDQVNGNLDFMMNAFGWLEQQEQTLSIRPKTTMQFPMQLSGMQQLIFGGLFVVVIPLAILVAGLVTWLRRRHL